MKTISARARVLGRPHRAGGRAGRAGRPPVPGLRVPGRADHRAGPAGAAAGPRPGLRPAPGGADGGRPADLRAQGITILTNMGAANPLAGAAVIKDVARRHGLGRAGDRRGHRG